MLPDNIRGQVIEELHASGASCIIYKAGEMHAFHRRGVADLYDVLTKNPDLLQQAFVADKVIGKGAAALLCAGHVAEVYTDVISEPAAGLLRAHAITVKYDSCVPNIINRQKTGYCPVEILCEPYGDNYQSCVRAIHDFLIKKG